MRAASEFEYLDDYRRIILRVQQWKIAEEVYGDADRQPAISDIENGHLPATFTDSYERILKVYRLEREPEQFERMVANGERRRIARELAKRQKEALTKSIADTEPLFSVADAAQEVLHSTNVSDRVLRILRETMNKRLG